MKKMSMCAFVSLGMILVAMGVTKAGAVLAQDLETDDRAGWADQKISGQTVDKVTPLFVPYASDVNFYPLEDYRYFTLRVVKVQDGRSEEYYAGGRNCAVFPLCQNINEPACLMLQALVAESSQDAKELQLWWRYRQDPETLQNRRCITGVMTRYP